MTNMAIYSCIQFSFQYCSASPASGKETTSNSANILLIIMVLHYYLWILQINDVGVKRSFAPNWCLRIAPLQSSSRNSINIRNPLIYYVNRYFLMFGGSQVQKPYHASMNGFLTFWPWHHNIKIFVENSALFYYEKSKVYFKETRKAGCIWTWENP